MGMTPGVFRLRLLSMRPRRNAVLACLVFAVSLALPSPAAAGGDRPAIVGVSVDRSPAEIRRVSHFWTPRRMRAAKPLGQPVAPAASASAAADRYAEVVERGVSHRVPGFRPPGSTALGSPPSPDALLRHTLERYIYYRYIIRNPRPWPYRTNGKVFANVRDGYFACSATVVGTPNRSVVFTAAHCVRGGGPSGEWLIRNWVFVPAYVRGRRPFGKFVARSLWTTDGWVSSGNRNYDVAAAVLYRNRGGRGRRVANLVGSVGIATGFPRDQYYYASGCPADRPFSGANLWACESPFGGTDPASHRRPGPDTTEIGCDLTSGSSGGGWLIRDNGLYLNGVISYGPPWPGQRTYGQYFGNTVWKLYKRVGRQ